MKYTDDEAITEIVRRGRVIRDRRNYGRLCALGGLSVGLAVALFVVLLTGVGFRLRNKGEPGGVAVVETTQASPGESNTESPETDHNALPEEFANVPGSEDEIGRAHV